MGLALGPELPPLDVKSVTITVIVSDGIVYNYHAVYAVSVVCVAGGTAWAALQTLPAAPLASFGTGLQPLWLADCAYAWHGVPVLAALTLTAKDNTRQSAALLLIDSRAHAGCMLMGHMPA